MAELDYLGTELGPPGFLGGGARMGERLAARGLSFIGTFLPQTFTDDERCARDREWMAGLLADLRHGLPEGARPFAVLSAAIDQPIRQQAAGRVARSTRGPARRRGLGDADRQPPPVRRAGRVAGLRAGDPPARGDVSRDGRRDRPAGGRDGPVARGPVPGYRPLPVRWRGPGGVAAGLRDGGPACPREGLPDRRARGRGRARRGRCGGACRRRVQPAWVQATRTSRRWCGRSSRPGTGAGWSSSRTSSWVRRTRGESVVAGQRANREYLRALGL